MPQPEELVVHLDNPAHGGTVISRVDGQVMFISGGLPGERDVRVQLDPPKNSKAKKGFRTGRAVHIGTPSSHRVPARCHAARLGAGCCDVDFVDATGSLELKRSVVLDQLSRIGRIRLDESRVNSVSLNPDTGWRTRVRLGVNLDGQAGLRKKSSREIVPLADATCPQWAEGLVDGLAEKSFTPGAEIAVAMGDDGNRGVVELTGSRRSRRRAVVAGQASIQHTVKADRPVTWQLPSDAFWQGHRAAPQFYTDWIRQHIPQGDGVGWDLYGGAGVFASALSDRVNAVDCVDIESASTHAGRQALATAGIENVRFFAGDVAKSIDALRTHDGLHAVVLDPPRTGASADVIAQVASAGPQHVVHIGCDPATASRDLAAWVEAGYQIEQLTVVDAFALTHHVEMLVYLMPRNDG